MFSDPTPSTPRKRLALVSAGALLLGLSTRAAMPAMAQSTSTPIKHVVVIFQENVSFDHYFGTYPRAQNPAGDPQFQAVRGTPSVNGLNAPGLLSLNPNSTNPFRLGRSQAVTCDQNHDYTAEQTAFDGGAMDLFPESVGTGSTPGSPCPDYGKGTGLTMGYYDGNTVTAMWNYAQHYAMSDNSFSSTFGPSTPGALNLISGQTFGVDQNHIKGDPVGSGNVLGQTVIGDPDPFYDDCGTPDQVALLGPNVGDLLNSKGLTWGWFHGGVPSHHGGNAIDAGDLRRDQ